MKPGVKSALKPYRASLSTPKRRKIIRRALNKNEITALGYLSSMLAALKKKSSALKRNVRFTRKLALKKWT